MHPTSTFTNRRYGEFLCFIMAFIICPFAVQSQNNRTELEQRMNDLYAHARQLRADLPTRDFRGNYFNMTLGTSAFGHIKTWRTENICDCEGNVVDTKNVSGNKAPVSLGLGWETRFSTLLSMRFMGSYSRLSHGRNRAVIDENDGYSTLLQDYTLTQFGAHSAALLHFKGFYTGAGINYTSSKASGFNTTTKSGNVTPPQYFKLKADVLTPKQTNFAGNVFVGYQMVASSYVLASIEMGFAQNFYMNVQLNFPLSGKTNRSLAEWQRAYHFYQKIRNEAIAIDHNLHPEKFQSDDCNNNAGSNSSSCPR